MVDRIKQIMEYEQMSSMAFADKINISRSSLTHIFNGRNQPSLDVAKKILIAFPEISTEWLIMGMGQMLQNVPVVEPASQPSTRPVDNMQQTDLFAQFSEPEEVEVSEPTPSNEPQVVENKIETPILESASEPETTVQVDPVVNHKPGRPRSKSPESHNAVGNPRRDRILNSQGDKKLVKIVFFYEDRSFEEYRPN